MKRFWLLAALAAAVAFAYPASAQSTRPWLQWRTLRTEHFDVHYPAELEAWARDAASRLEPVHAAVGPVVGSVPARRVTVVIDDPAGETNGSAYSFLRTPFIQLYPTPSDPRLQLGHTRDYTEQLALHEFAHIAHLTRPSRNPLTRLWSEIGPRGFGPLAGTPRWVKEGYATYVEGRLTGSGRPHGAYRAAILRQWALEGKLPAYGELDAVTGRYQAGAMAYLVGSAYLEWLAERRGDESLVHLWRRMSARRGRSFTEAFRGVYGGSPQDLYGLFVVEVTCNALLARSSLAEAGLVTGDTVQHLAWHTGDPAVSPGGEHMAVTLRGPTAAWSRVVVWRTAEEAEDSATAAARARELARDPEDVPGIEIWPRARRVLATLGAAGGEYGYAQPRFLPGEDEMLVVRSAPLGGGVSRADLFAWNWKRHTIRQITHAAGIRSADPAPDGRRAAAVQCRAGFCGLVMVDLRTGAIAPLAPGAPGRVFDRPRFSPDGRTVVAAMQEGGRWKVAAVPAAGGPVRVLFEHPGASAYDPVFSPDGQSLVLVSEAGGVPNLARVRLGDGTLEPLTRVTGLAVGPDVDRKTGEVYFLSLHASGLDLHRLPADAPGIGAVSALPANVGAVGQRVAGAVPDTLPRAVLPDARRYGLGPRWNRLLPWGASTLDGSTAGLALHNGDPIGRLGMLARAAVGDRGVERGASVSAVWRGTRPSLQGEAFYLSHHPSRLGGYAPTRFDADYAGGLLSADNEWTAGRMRRYWRVGASAGRLDLDKGDGGPRVLAFAQYEVGNSRRQGRAYSSSLLSLSGSVGQTSGESWRRGQAMAVFGAGWGVLGLRGEATLARVSGGAPAWERFTVGGAGPLLVDGAVLGQRVRMPALRWGALEGEHLLTYRASTSLGGVTPYLWGGTTDPGWREWIRVVGVEAATSLRALPAGNLPGIRTLFGVAYGLDGAYENDLTAYVGLTLTP